MAVNQSAHPAVHARARAARSIPLLQAGFRPFFLLAGVWAVAAVGLWVPAYVGFFSLPSAFAPMTWHLHEAIYGFAVAAIAGFLLTAVPNWTGRLPIGGLPLAGLALLWIAGRIFCFISGWTGWEAAMAVDLAFLVVFFLVIAREVIAGRNWRNLPPALVIAVLALGNASVHLEHQVTWIPEGLGGRIGISALVLLITLIGGRIVPSFTRNWLAKRQSRVFPTAFNRFDRWVAIATILALVLWSLHPAGAVAGTLLALAGILQLTRLSRWRGAATFAEPLVTILHLGYLWVGLGLLLLGCQLLFEASFLRGALHALAAGAAGTMILAVMTRASLGHSGRPLTAGAGTTASYLLVTLAVLARVVAPAFPTLEIALLTLSAWSWVAAFGLFVALYAPMLLRARAGA